MNLSPEIKAQLAEQKKQCLFCKIVSKETQGKVVYEDSKTEAILDIYPAVKGHVLFFQKEHYPILPYLPEEDFNALFGTLPALVKVIKGAIVTTALNVFIANGGAAGQQSPHFMMHLMPRDLGDGFFNFLLKQKKQSLPEDKVKLLVDNLPLFMKEYFQKNNSSWHTGKGAPFKTEGTILYEDEKVACVLPKEGAVAGQIEIYSKVEETYLEKLSADDCVHFFSAASTAASLLFQALGVQGTNMIVKSGKTDDHTSGKLCIYVLPRQQDDSLGGLLWKPEQPKYDLDGVAGKIKDKTWKITEERKKEVVKKPEVIQITDTKKEGAKEDVSSKEAIRLAIEKIRR